MLEAHAVTLSLRWILRSVRRHSRRTVLLVDATAVCGALAKGRSSSPTLKRELMKIGALAIAGDLWLRVVYVPSEDNPSDAPSRGVVRRWLSSPRPQKPLIAKKQVYDASDLIHKFTHSGPIAVRNKFRRFFRRVCGSDVASLSSLDSDPSVFEGGH